MSDDLWETHADWWIAGFTEGADPEYSEQILPLAEAELRGAERVLDIGCGDGQVSRLAAALGAEVVGIDPTWNCVRVAARAGRWAGLSHGPAPRRCRLPTPRSTSRWPASCSSTSTPSTRRSPRWPGSSPGRHVLLLPQPSDPPGARQRLIDDHMVDPPEYYYRLGPYLDETESIEQVELDVWIRFVHRPLSRYVNVLRRQRTQHRQDGRAGAATRLPRAGPGLRGQRSIPSSVVPAADEIRAEELR